MTPALMAVLGTLALATGVTSMALGISQENAWPGAFNFLVGCALVVTGVILLAKGLSA